MKENKNLYLDINIYSVMKYLKKFNESRESIEEICQKFGIRNFTVNPDGSIDVESDVNLSDKKLTKLPLKFNKVSGHFYCDYNNLTTLEGAPREVGGDFYCPHNNIVSVSQKV